MSPGEGISSGAALRISPGRLVLVGTLFAASGASALVYQVAWQRILALHSGVGIYSVAMIVAAFLAGLGLGSYAGGVLSVRTSPLAALRAFAVLELIVGIFALGSASLYYDLLYLRFPAAYSTPWRAGVVHFLTLMLPTTCMGMSLPFLVRALVFEARTASRTIGYLYGVNVLGAAAGALLTPWVLVRWLGVEGALRVGGLGSLFAGLTALWLGFRGGAGEGRAAQGEELAIPPNAEPAGRHPFALWLCLYTVTGFCALSLEILWFRVMDVAVKSTAFTFGTVLSVYLLGLGAGSLVGGPLAIRLRRPLEAFLVCQCSLLLCSGVAMLLLVKLPPGLPLYDQLVSVWASYDEFKLGEEWIWSRILLLYGALPITLYGAPTFLMGLSFSVLQRAVQDDRQKSGLKVGILQAGNIVGNVMGSLVTGLVLLSAVGTMGTLRLLLAVGVAFALLGIAFYGMRWTFASLAAALFVVFVVLPGGDELWLRLHGQLQGPAAIDEDATAVVAITPETVAGALRLSVDGKGHSWLPFGVIGIHSQLGAIPALIHPDPREVAIIGLGSGDTAWAASCRPGTERITVFELGAPEERLLRRVASETQLGDLTRFLADPRVEILTRDGRNALALSQKKYDLIEADATRPQSAYAGNLYSLEFFELCRSRLKPGGLMCTWSPTPRIYATFCTAFRHVVELDGGSVLVGSNEPITIDLDGWSARLVDSGAAAFLGPYVSEQTARFLRTALPALPDRTAETRLNRDLFPRDEFLTPRSR